MSVNAKEFRLYSSRGWLTLDDIPYVPLNKLEQEKVNNCVKYWQGLCNVDENSPDFFGQRNSRWAQKIISQMKNTITTEMRLSVSTDNNTKKIFDSEFYKILDSFFNQTENPLSNIYYALELALVFGTAFVKPIINKDTNTKNIAFEVIPIDSAKIKVYCNHQGQLTGILYKAKEQEGICWYELVETHFDYKTDEILGTVFHYFSVDNDNNILAPDDYLINYVESDISFVCMLRNPLLNVVNPSSPFGLPVIEPVLQDLQDNDIDMALKRFEMQATAAYSFVSSDVLEEINQPQDCTTGTNTDKMYTPPIPQPAYKIPEGFKRIHELTTRQVNISKNSLGEKTTVNDLIQLYSPPIRIEEYAKNNEMNLLAIEKKLNLSAGTLSPLKDRILTATEILNTEQSIVQQCSLWREALKTLVVKMNRIIKFVLDDKTNDTNIVSVEFGDAIIRPTETVIKEQQTLLELGLTTRVDAYMTIHNVDLATAQAKIKEIEGLQSD